MKNKQAILIADKIAIIDENNCIGCTKCIRVCPVDAILGAAKHIHTVIKNECTGCELCIESCPVNCITVLPIPYPPSALQPPRNACGASSSPVRGEGWRESAEQRLNFRKFRLQREKREKIKKQETIQTRKTAIQEALLRAQEKKLNKKMDRE